MDAFAYVNPSYSDEEETDEDEDEGEGDDRHFMGYTFLESIAEETSDDLRSLESRSEPSSIEWGWASDAGSVIHVSQVVNRDEKFSCQVPNAKKGEQLDKWLEDSMCVGGNDRSGLPALDLESSTKKQQFSAKKNFICEWNDALDSYLNRRITEDDFFVTELKRSASLEGFLIPREYTSYQTPGIVAQEKNEDEIINWSSSDEDCDASGKRLRAVCEDLTQIAKWDEFGETGSDSESNVECYNGFVKGYQEYKSEVKNVRPSNENLSEDSGFCEAGREGENDEARLFTIDVIVEEESEDQIVKKESITQRDELISSTGWQQSVLEREWERSMRSGRAATDDWLVLKIKPEKKISFKKSSSLPCVVGLDVAMTSSDSCSAPASMLRAEKGTQVLNNQEEVCELGMPKSRDMQSAAAGSQEGSRIGSDSQRKYTEPNWAWGASTDAGLDLSQRLPQLNLEETTSSLEKFEFEEVECAMPKSPKTVHFSEGSFQGGGQSRGQTPVRDGECNGIYPKQVERVQVSFVNGDEDKKEKSWIVCAWDNHESTDVIVPSHSNIQYGTSNQVQRVHLKDDTASRALQDGYQHLERAITYLQQEIDDKTNPQPPTNSSRCHIWNARQQYFDNEQKTPADISRVFDDFRQRAQQGRERAARSVLDLNAIDRCVRHQIDSVTSPTAAPSSSSPRRSPAVRGPDSSRASRRRSRSAGYLETDIDSLLSRQVIEPYVDEWDNSPNLVPQSKAVSMLSLRRPHDERATDDAERARSMEFLLDADNKAAAQPPENQLMHGDGKTLSEHELRIRRSLQQLDVPEWFKNSPYSQGGSFLLKKKEEEGSERWQGLSSRTPSASSVASCRYATASSNLGASTPSSTSAMTRILPPYCWRYTSRWSKESLQSPGSPSPMQEKTHTFARWGSISKSPSPTGSLPRATALLTRQPYLGWRSSEKLTREISSAESTPTHTSSHFYRSAAERLSAGPGYYALRYGAYASKPSSEGSLLSARRAVSAGPSPTEPSTTILRKPSSHKPPIPPKPHLSPTSGMYKSTVSHQNGSDEDSSRLYCSVKDGEESPKSPRQPLVWMESSFVGVKPLVNNGKDSGEVEDLSRGTTPSPCRSGANSDEEEVRLSKAKRSFGQLRYEEENQSRDSGSSVAGLEEVLDSLLAIPSSSRSVSPASRSQFYLGDESDSSLTPSRRESAQEAIEPKTAKNLRGPISDHLLASTIGQSSTDDDTSISQLDNYYLQEQSLRLPTPPPAPIKPPSPIVGESETQQHHVHWGPDEISSPQQNSVDTVIENTETDAQAESNDAAKKIVKDSKDLIKISRNVNKDETGKTRRGSEQLRNLLPDDLLVRCSYPTCAKTVEWVEARRSFKTCHNCYTYYCSRECRRVHWDKHRRTCMYSRIRSLCKHVILRSRDDPAVQAHLTKLARTGMISQGRGFVKLGFRNPELVERFLRQGWQALEDNPIYVAWRDLIPQELGPEVFHEVTETCKHYNPETKFVLLAAVYLTREIPEQPVPRWEREVIAKCSKISLRKWGTDDGYDDSLFEPDTLILTAVPQPSDMSPERAREQCLHNILRHLRQRGVSLRHQFPEVYKMLTGYVERSEIFPPITIYPKDGRTGKTFMCLIMPNTEPEIEAMVNDFSRK